MAEAAQEASPRIGLALSGGGFRATLFHLGVIRFLRDIGYLRLVETITSVSGGSVMAAHLVRHWEQYNGSNDAFDRITAQLLAFIRSDVRGRIVRRVPHSSLYRSTTDALAAAYGELFPGDTLGELAPSEDVWRPQLHLLASNLTRGSLAAFSSHGIRFDAFSPEPPIFNSSFPLTEAVAASSAFPVLFPPLRIDEEKLLVPQRTLPHGPQYLTDGGIFDNSGVAYLKHVVSDTGVDLILCSNAGAIQDWERARLGLVKGLNRAVNMIMHRVSDLERERSGNVTAIDINTITQGAHDVHRDLQSLLPSLRTDFDVFSRIETNCLVRHGYAVAAEALQGRSTLEPWCPAEAQITRSDEKKSSRWKSKLARGRHRRARLVSLHDRMSFTYLTLACLLAASTWYLSGASNWVSPWLIGLFRHESHGWSTRGIDYVEVADLIAGPGTDEMTSKFKRGFMNNILATAFEPLPITGDAHETQTLNITNHCTCWIQGSKKLVRLQKFNVPEGAKQVRARGRQTVDVGEGYAATVWVYIEKSGELRELKRSSTEHWRLSPDDGGGVFYSIALYDISLFEHTGEYTGAEIDDLAGKVDKLRFTIGGKLKDLRFKEVFRFPPEIPMRFYQYREEAIHDLVDPRAKMLADFAGVLDTFRSSQGTQTERNRQDAVKVWDEVTSSDAWAGFELDNVRDDLILRITGKREQPVPPS